MSVSEVKKERHWTWLLVVCLYIIKLDQTRMKENKPQIWSGHFLDVTEYILTGPNLPTEPKGEENPQQEHPEVQGAFNKP